MTTHTNLHDRIAAWYGDGRTVQVLDGSPVVPCPRCAAGIPVQLRDGGDKYDTGPLEVHMRWHTPSGGSDEARPSERVGDLPRRPYRVPHRAAQRHLPGTATRCGPPMNGTCAKVRYRDEIAAQLALATVARQDKTARPKTERRAYRCPKCTGWHLTSRKTKTS